MYLFPTGKASGSLTWMNDMPRTRYLVCPPVGFCAAFIVWAESPELAIAYSREWLGVELPSATKAYNTVNWRSE